jgi:ribosomal protein S18 acetylase RimI-like enzyme
VTTGPATPAFGVRPATPADIGFLADVVLEATRAQGRLQAVLDEPKWREDFGEWTEQQLRDEANASAMSVIELDGEPIGRLRVTRDTEQVHLAGIQLLPAVQGRGVGTAIIDQLKAEAEAAGVPLTLSVEHDNPRARALYERLGFVEVGKDAEKARLRWLPGALTA